MLHFDANPITSGYLEGFNNAKYNMKQRNLNIVLAIISKTTSPTPDSFFLIMSRINKFVLTWGHWGPSNNTCCFTPVLLVSGVGGFYLF